MDMTRPKVKESKKPHRRKKDDRGNEIKICGECGKDQMVAVLFEYDWVVSDTGGFYPRELIAKNHVLYCPDCTELAFKASDPDPGDLFHAREFRDGKLVHIYYSRDGRGKMKTVENIFTPGVDYDGDDDYADEDFCSKCAHRLVLYYIYDCERSRFGYFKQIEHPDIKRNEKDEIVVNVRANPEILGPDGEPIFSEPTIGIFPQDLPIYITESQDRHEHAEATACPRCQGVGYLEAIKKGAAGP
jgi:hypothetical protein